MVIGGLFVCMSVRTATQKLWGPESMLRRSNCFHGPGMEIQGWKDIKNLFRRIELELQRVKLKNVNGSVA
jgi:hypothetical protein